MLRRIQKEESRKTVVGAPEGQVGNFA
jgi:hypothetical protein